LTPRDFSPRRSEKLLVVKSSWQKKVAGSEKFLEVKNYWERRALRREGL
jgi:hypothetical protein